MHNCRLAVSITVERLVAVRIPLHAHVYLKRRRILIGIICIYAAAVLLNVHFLFSLRVVRVLVCNSSTFTIGLMVAAEDTEPIAYNYGRYSLTVFIIAVQIIPLIALITVFPSISLHFKRALKNCCRSLMLCKSN